LPFVFEEPATRNSKNRAKATLMTTNIESINKETRKMIIDKVLPAIKEKWPVGSRKGKSLINKIMRNPIARLMMNGLFRSVERMDGIYRFGVNLQTAQI
jgi:hypothetical protein